MIRYNSVSYNVNEGLLQSTIVDVEFDKYNFCWIIYPNGIQRFDGATFKLIPIQPGLPDNKLCRFFKTSTNELIISHSKGISRYNAESNRFIQTYTYPTENRQPAQIIGEDEGFIYFLTKDMDIYSLTLSNFTIVQTTQTGLNKLTKKNAPALNVSIPIFNHKISILCDNIIYQWDLKNKRIVGQSPELNGISTFFLYQKNEDEVLFYKYKGTETAIEVYNYKTHNIKMVADNLTEKNDVGRLNIFDWNGQRFITVNNRVYLVNAATLKREAEIVNFKNQPFGGEHAITKVHKDNFGNIYLQTISGGIRKIISNNYPIRFYNNGVADRNFCLAVLADKKNNQVLAGAIGSGILVYDTLQHFIKQVKITDQYGNIATINVLLKTPSGSYLAFGNGLKTVFELDADLNIKKRIFISNQSTIAYSGTSYFSKILKQDAQGALVQTETKIFRITFSPLSVSMYNIAMSYTMSGVYFYPYIITHNNDELVFLNAEHFNTIKKIPFKNTGNVRCFTLDKDKKIYMGSNNGIYIIDSTGKILSHFTKETGLPDDCIYSMEFDKSGYLWCSTNKGIFKFKDGKVLEQLKKEDGIQENEFNTNVSSQTPDGELYFGGVNGVSSFYPDAISVNKENINLLITRILANNEAAIKDTATWNIDRIVLPYSKNSIAVDFIAMGGLIPDQYLYQYKMKGVDKEWIFATSLQTIRYSLQPGKYTLQLYAARSFDNDAIPMKELSIIIRPPFWKTWWFLSGIGILILSTVGIFINQKNKRKYEKKLQILENERRLKEERERISRDLHDSLGVYANAVLYNTELLEKEKTTEKGTTIISDLKFASKDIITSLRETVWALKKESYSAADCLVRIRNFVQPLTRYYRHIEFKIEGDAPSNVFYNYSKALNIVRIVQEAIANSIKHAQSKEIKIASEMSEDQRWKILITDNGNGFDYEHQKETSAGNGLANMKQRAAVSEIELTCISITNKGTNINLTI